uniref:RING-type E3 ubiquitin transferase n=1 Tax=Branchiostoma floridae TaxID=7739 RepID=C3ZJ64_BRAFL|eukprot:XP_002591384.1 hypothetical protein BRAFLDRAFT_86891 [Branchiostoma floridae]
MAAVSPRLGELFHEELTCSICLELFTRPKVLPCQHTFCQDCLQDLMNMIAKKYRKCPNCRRKVRLPATDREGNLWVVGFTKSAEFAVLYNKQGRVLRKFDLRKTKWDRGVAVDTRRNHILITQTTGDEDNEHGEVFVFRPDGTLVRTVGLMQGMKRPGYITVDGEGNILVSDRENHCVFVYNEDGQFLFQFGGWGSGEGQFKTPNGICTDRAGNIIVVDSMNHRVEMFDKTGRFLKHVATYIMLRPWGVAMAAQGQLVVTEVENNTVRIIPSY